MAVSTPGIESSAVSAWMMRDMALHAEKRHCYLQHIIVHRPMRTMATGAILGIFSVLIKERAFLISMALSTDFLHRCLSEQIIIGSAVRLMTVRAEDLLLVYGVVARQGKFGPDFLMAAFAHIIHLRPPYREIRPHVDIVAFEAGNIVDSMGSCIPVMEIEIRRCSMTFEADKRLGRFGEVFQVDQSLIVAGCLLTLLRILRNFRGSKTLNRNTSRPMA